jgi:malonyl-CoA O-methyltransferase
MSDRPPSVAAVRRIFDARAEDFDDYAFVYDEVRARLLDRLEGINTAPGWMLDLGCASGRGATALTSLFPSGELIMLDASGAMASKARTNTGGIVLNAALPQLPLVDASLGLVFANLCLPYSDNIRSALLSVARVLEPGGLFVFATLGPDSFAELQGARAALGDKVWPAFADMHHLGDALVQSGLADPVLDVDYLQVSYRDWNKLWRELVNSGAAPGQNVTGGLLGSGTRSNALKDEYPQIAGESPYRITLELVFGHAWRSPQQQAAQGPTEVGVPVTQIKRR